MAFDRFALLSVFLIALAACGTSVSPNERILVVSDAGVQIIPTGGSCAIPAFSNEISRRYGYLRIVQDGSIRDDPQFNFLKPGIELNTARRAEGVVRGFDEEFRSTCAKLDQAPPELKASMWAYYSKALGLMVDTAMRFESFNTVEQYETEVVAAREKRLALTKSKPDMK